MVLRVVERTNLEDFDLDKTSDFDFGSDEGQRNRARANILIGDVVEGWSGEGDCNGLLRAVKGMGLSVWL